ncbi:hypothetical protein BOTBODRAFT_486468 [Botryobasidium botryosum FD-172 SS1]|nr:hypothetical protein BOTBODRAFT_486468 [Botryobasidium botryosum FD-172 SS1]
MDGDSGHKTTPIARTRTVNSLRHFLLKKHDQCRLSHWLMPPTKFEVNQTYLE